LSSENELTLSKKFWRRLPSDGKVILAGARRVGLRSLVAGAGHAHAMKANKGHEYCLIVEGAYLSEAEAEHALRDPFIEDWVEETGRYRIHNMGDIEVTPGVALGSLGVVMLDDRLFEIASVDPEHPLTEHKAKGIADALRRYDMFDDIQVELREDDFED
jgi:hypothetical protein